VKICISSSGLMVTNLIKVNAITDATENFYVTMYPLL